MWNLREFYQIRKQVLKWMLERQCPYHPYKKNVLKPKREIWKLEGNLNYRIYARKVGGP